MFTFTTVVYQKDSVLKIVLFRFRARSNKSFQNSFSEFVQILLSPSGSGFQSASAWPRSWITNPAASSLLPSDPSSAWNDICIFSPDGQIFHATLRVEQGIEEHRLYLRQWFSLVAQFQIFSPPLHESQAVL